MAPGDALRPAIFLDRDGTLIREVDYLADPELVELLPGAVEGLRAWRRAGYALVLATNQSGIARGLVTLEQLEAIHERLARELAEHDLALDDIRFCPHHPTEGEAPNRRGCGCRKPAPGMLFAAAAELDLDLEASWMIGDALRDLEAGSRAGGRSILVRTGKGARTEPEVAPGTPVANDLAEAARYVLAHRAPS